MTYVITLEPEKKLYNKIIKLKGLAKKIAGHQLYLKDEPHLTLYLGNFKDLLKIKTELKNLSKKLKKTNVKIKAWFVFKNDIITKKNTLVCELDNKTTEKLRKIQLKVISILNKYRKKELSERYEKAYKALGPMGQANINRYGFPFIGNSWKPHFSIASFEKKAFDKVWIKLKNLCPKGSYSIISLNIYSLEVKDKSIKPIGKYLLSQ